MPSSALPADAAMLDPTERGGGIGLHATVALTS